jgi:hypothetical protein
MKMRGQRGEEADDEATKHIDDDCAPGECLADQARGNTRAPETGDAPRALPTAIQK